MVFGSNSGSSNDHNAPDKVMLAITHPPQDVVLDFY